MFEYADVRLDILEYLGRVYELLYAVITLEYGEKLSIELGLVFNVPFMDRVFNKSKPACRQKSLASDANSSLIITL